MNGKEKILVLSALARQDLSPHARLLLITLILAGDDTSAGITTIASRADLAAIAGTTRRTILRVAGSLEQAGLLVRTRRNYPEGGSAATAYTVLTDRVAPEGA